MQPGVWISLAAYFLLMLAIGVYAWRKSTSNSEEYMLGGRSLSPSVAAMSAGASDMSGWLLLGLPGALFVSGLSQSWIGIGLVVGAWLNWLIVAPRLRQQTEEYDNSLTIPGFLGKSFPQSGGAAADRVGDHHRGVLFGLYRLGLVGAASCLPAPLAAIT